MNPITLFQGNCFNTKDVVSQNNWSDLEGQSPQENAEDFYCDDGQRFGEYPCDPVLFILVNDNESKTNITKAHCGVRTTVIKSMESVDRIYLWKLDGDNISYTYVKLLFPYYKFPLLSIHIDENGLYNLKHSQTFLFAIRSIGKRYVGTGGDDYVSAIHGQDIEIFTLMPVENPKRFLDKTFTISDIPEVRPKPIRTNIKEQVDYVKLNNQYTKYGVRTAGFFDEIKKYIYSDNITEIEVLQHKHRDIDYKTLLVSSTSVVNLNKYFIMLVLVGKGLMGVNIKGNNIKTITNPEYASVTERIFGTPFSESKLSDEFKQSIREIRQYGSGGSLIKILKKDGEQLPFIYARNKYRFSVLTLNQHGFEEIVLRIWDDIDKIQLLFDEKSILIPTGKYITNTTADIAMYMFTSIAEETKTGYKVEIYRTRDRFGYESENLSKQLEKLLFSFKATKIWMVTDNTLIQIDKLKYVYVGRIEDFVGVYSFNTGSPVENCVSDIKGQMIIKTKKSYYIPAWIFYVDKRSVSKEGFDLAKSTVDSIAARFYIRAFSYTKFAFAPLPELSVDDMSELSVNDMSDLE